MALELEGHGAAERVAGDETCSVYRCPCGCVHLHVGPFTVRLAAHAFRALTIVLLEAAESMAAAPPPRSH